MRTVWPLLARSSAVWLAASLALGCVKASGTGTGPVEQYTSRSPDRPQLPVTEVREIDDVADHGMSVDRYGGIVIPPDYPTTAEPHVLVGVYGLRYRSPDKLPPEKEKGMALKAAAKHGANAVHHGHYLGSTVYYLLHLSSAAPVFPPPGPLLDKIEGWYGSGDYKRYGADEKRTLEAFDSVKLPARAMTCFRAAIALDERATLAKDLSFQLQVVITARGSTRDISVPLHTPLSQERSFFIQLGCYANSQGVSWQFANIPADKPLGAGSVLVRSFAMAADMRLRKRFCAEMQDTDRASASDQGMCLP